MEGVLPVVPTPFKEDGGVDLASLERVVDDAVERRAFALVYPGVASEDVLLTPEERSACLATVVKTVADRIPVVAGVNSDQPQGMVDYARGLADTGVGAVMAMAIPAMGAETEAWFARMADVLDGKPIILQNLGAPRGADPVLAVWRAGRRVVHDAAVVRPGY